MGCWSYDAQRFRSRVHNLQELLTPFFSEEHRRKVYDQLQKNNENNCAPETTPTDQSLDRVIPTPLHNGHRCKGTLEITAQRSGKDPSP
jgi:hypothetical protein